MNSTKRITIAFLLVACLAVTPLAGCHRNNTKAGKSGSSLSSSYDLDAGSAAAESSDSLSDQLTSGDSAASQPGDATGAASGTGPAGSTADGTTANPATVTDAAGSTGATGGSTNQGTTGTDTNTNGNAGGGGTGTADTGTPAGNGGGTTPAAPASPAAPAAPTTPATPAAPSTPTAPATPAAPSHSQYYVAPPSSSGYNSGLTDMYNSHFAQGSTYGGSETSVFHSILMKFATGQIDGNKAQDELGALTWTENGHPSTVRDTGADFKDIGADDDQTNDAQYIHNVYKSSYDAVIHPSGTYWIGNAIVYNKAFGTNTIYTLYCNIKQY